MAIDILPERTQRRLPHVHIPVQRRLGAVEATRGRPVSKPALAPTVGKASNALAELLLTAAALLGLVTLVGTVGAVRAGLQPLVVRSGSMEPTIHTGSMVLVRKIPAAQIKVGDVVAVERPDHTRVTHRVIARKALGPNAELTLKGDANEDPDPVPVTVSHAYRMVGSVPLLGRVGPVLATAPGGFAMGCLVTFGLVRGGRRQGRRRAT